MSMTFEVCSLCGLHGRISLGDGINAVNVACKDHANRMILSATIHAGISDLEAAALVEAVKNSSIPEINNATDSMLWAAHITNEDDIIFDPTDICYVFTSVENKDVPSDFRETMKKHLKQGTHA